eukprot:scaffold1757_cov266-Pinguiococcus_pyrenoidosus.AAC.14
MRIRPHERSTAVTCPSESLGPHPPKVCGGIRMCFTLSALVSVRPGRHILQDPRGQDPRAHDAHPQQAGVVVGQRLSRRTVEETVVRADEALAAYHVVAQRRLGCQRIHVPQTVAKVCPATAFDASRSSGIVRSQFADPELFTRALRMHRLLDRVAHRLEPKKISQKAGRASACPSLTEVGYAVLHRARLKPIHIISAHRIWHHDLDVLMVAHRRELQKVPPGDLPSVVPEVVDDAPLVSRPPWAPVQAVRIGANDEGPCCSGVRIQLSEQLGEPLQVGHVVLCGDLEVDFVAELKAREVVVPGLRVVEKLPRIGRVPPTQGQIRPRTQTFGRKAVGCVPAAVSPFDVQAEDRRRAQVLQKADETVEALLRQAPFAANVVLLLLSIGVDSRRQDLPDAVFPAAMRAVAEVGEVVRAGAADAHEAGKGRGRHRELSG